jgi:Tfp pilus assembly protein PilP
VIRLFRSNSIIAAGVIILFVTVSFAVEAKKDPPTIIKEQQTKKVEAKFDIGDFEYKSEGRRDPFEPVLLLREQSRREVKIIKDKKSTADALNYQLEELKLVGILKSDKGMMAMMEDTQGKGIFFRKGDPLNQNMWVADISGSNVIFAYKLKGEIKKVIVDLPIKK